MTRIMLRTCVLNLAGIPDLADLQDIELKVSAIDQVDTRIAVDATAPDRPSFYPFAIVRVGPKLHFVPLDREDRLDAANHSIEILIRGLPAHRRRERGVSGAAIRLCCKRFALS